MTLVLPTVTLQNKIDRQRRQAPSDLPKARWCTQVVDAFVSGSPALDLALAELKAGVAPNWSIVTAFQFMAGRQAFLCAQLEDGPNKARMLLVHRVAEALMQAGALTKHDLRVLRGAAVSAWAEASKPQGL